jgi:hypothetical protein
MPSYGSSPPSAATSYVVPYAAPTVATRPYTWTAAPPSGVAAFPSPASAYGTSLSTPSALGTSWDPYLTAQRPAILSGNITSPTSSQYILPQPMPRVPYYTNQPVSPTNQPYTIVPDVSQPVGPNGTVICPGAMPPPLVANPCVPILNGPLPPTPIYPSVCPQPAGARWYLDADGIFFTRDARIGNQALVLLDMNAATQSNVLLSNSDLDDFQFEPGPRVLIGYMLSPENAIEASYFGIYNWKVSKTVHGDNDLNLPGDLGLNGNLNFFDADTATVTYKSLIHNAEINYVHNIDNIGLLVGFRYFYLQDQFSETFTDVQTGSSSYNISSFNDLFGGQIGARLTRERGNFGFDFTGKAGVYGNNIHSSQRVSDFNGFEERNNSVNAGQIAFIGDLELNTSYRFSQNWSLRGGYQVYWLEGMALAPSQLDFTDTATSGTTLHKTDTMLMQGAHAGLMAQW